MSSVSIGQDILNKLVTFSNGQEFDNMHVRPVFRICPYNCVIKKEPNIAHFSTM